VRRPTLEHRRPPPSERLEIATPTVAWAAPTQPASPNILARTGRGLWSLLTSVDFAVAQIILLVLLAVVGMTIQQLPSWADRSVADHIAAMDAIHTRYDALFGTSLVDTLDHLTVFTIFRSLEFSFLLTVLVISIVVCTLDRTPKLWRGVADVRVVQPEPYFDPRLPDRAAMTGLPAATVETVLRRHHFKVRTATDDAGSTFVYGDRHQYTKLATLLTHTGLVLFLVAAAVTSRLGHEEGLVVPEGESLTVQPIGTPGLLLVKNLGFDAPGLDTGTPSDFTTDLAVYRDGQEIARKTIRVNDPLSVGGYTFHQNGFGPAPYLVVRDAAGKTLWDGAVPLTDAAADSPYGILPVPGRDIGLQLLLSRDPTTNAPSVLILPYRIVGTDASGTSQVEHFLPMAPLVGDTVTSPDTGLSVQLREVGAYTLLIAKQDPGQGLVWLAFASLIAGITISFYLPRRRVWVRRTPDDRLAIVWRSDRYVDVEREFGRLLDDFVAARPPD
jgi:cytochrome c biogenesis protein